MKSFSNVNFEGAYFQIIFEGALFIKKNLKCIFRGSIFEREVFENIWINTYVRR